MSKFSEGSNRHQIEHDSLLLELLQNCLNDNVALQNPTPYEEALFINDFKFIQEFMGALKKNKSSKKYAQLLLQINENGLFQTRQNMRRSKSYVRNLFIAKMIAEKLLDFSSFEKVNILFNFLYDRPFFFFSYRTKGYLSNETNIENPELKKLLKYFKEDIKSELGNVKNILAGKLFLEIKNDLTLNCSTEYFLDKDSIASGEWFKDYARPNCIECFTFIHLLERSYFLDDIEQNNSHKEFSVFINENIYLKYTEKKTYFPVRIENRWPKDLNDNYIFLKQWLNNAHQYIHTFPDSQDELVKKKPGKVDDELRELSSKVVEDILKVRETFINKFIKNLD